MKKAIMYLLVILLAILLIVPGVKVGLLSDMKFIIGIELSLLAVSYTVFSFIHFPLMQLNKDNSTNGEFGECLLRVLNENEQNIKYMFIVIVSMLVLNFLLSIDIPLISSQLFINNVSIKVYILYIFMNFFTISFFISFYDILCASFMIFKSQFKLKNK